MTWRTLVYCLKSAMAEEYYLDTEPHDALTGASAALLEQQATITELAHLRDNVLPDTLQELDNANATITGYAIEVRELQLHSEALLREARATIDRLTAERDTLADRVRDIDATLRSTSDGWVKAYADRKTELEAERKLADDAYRVVAQMWPGIVGTPEENYGTVSEAHAAATAFVAAWRVARSSTPTPTDTEPT